MIENEKVEEMMFELEERCEKTLNALENEYMGIRAGRANPHILDRIEVEAYGGMSKLIELGNVSALDADFFVFSGHKIFAPTGIGVVYGKKELLEAAEPYHGGGNMIADVTFERTIYNPIPNKFEAGTEVLRMR